MDLVFYQIGLSSVYHPYLVTTDWLKHIKKERNSTNELLTRQLLIEMYSRWLPHEAGCENAKSVIKAKGGYFEESQI